MNNKFINIDDLREVLKDFNEENLGVQLVYSMHTFYMIPDYINPYKLPRMDHIGLMTYANFVFRIEDNIIELIKCKTNSKEVLDAFTECGWECNYQSLS